MNGKEKDMGSTDDPGVLARQSYPVGTELVHHSGEVWKVSRAGDLADDEHSDGMVPLADDYVIALVDDPRRGVHLIAPGKQMRVHADYLHGNGWRRRDV